VVERAHLPHASRIVADVTGAEPTVDIAVRSVTAPTGHGVETLVRAAKAFTDARIPLDDLSLRQPTLDEVFLTLTGSVPDDTPAEEAIA
ncbi:MAG: daunorubicin/doxorubicin resistance ABC transporter ATP-binding protein DrrA, partial [Actinomycetota bacterium]|nr:daunorubicin/doxorubicin resistance ABC transporter ATP-binding protein DrrA [Actinomycetota bacterium]